jgi:NAD-dependent oxidoreductase involved in siderophore biosynthesis
MNDMVFQTGGDWDSTTLFNNGTEVQAAQLFVELHAGRDDFGDPTTGGIWDGADLTAIVRPQEDPDTPFDILPGRLTLQFPEGVVVLENYHPMVELTATRVLFNNDDVTNRVVDLYVDINAADDVVKAFLTVYKPHWIRRDEVITYTFLA